MDMHAETPMTLYQVNVCTQYANQRYPTASTLAIKVLLATEGGQIGTIRKNTDDSYDLGPMQINTIHLVDIRHEFGFTARDLVYNPCKNILVGTWLLSKHILAYPGAIWKAIGSYHSKTPRVREIYLSKARKSYVRLIQGIKDGRESKALGRTTNWGREVVYAPSPLLSSARDFSRPPRVETIDSRKKPLKFID